MPGRSHRSDRSSRPAAYRDQGVNAALLIAEIANGVLQSAEGLGHAGRLPQLPLRQVCYCLYLDPPFNSNANYAAPIGSKTAGAAFKDTWGLDDINLAWHGEIKAEYPGLYDLLQATRTIHGDSMMNYLIYMAIRLMEMKRLLKDSGSVYLHCDPTASHYLKLLMGAIFGMGQFRTDISWKRSSAHNDTRQGRKQHGRIHDVLLFYTKTDQWVWNSIYTDYDEDYINRFYPHTEPETGRRYALGDLTGPGGAAKGNPSYEVLGVTRYWRYSQDKMDALLAEGRIVQKSPGSVPRYKRYLDEMSGVLIQDLWTDLRPVQAHAKERQGYPTQKPVALLRRIIQASSNPGDMILDPFCGCATACIAAASDNRQWVGIDISSKAADLVQSRMQDELGLFFTGTHRTDIPKRTDLGKVIPYNDARNKKYLYGEQGGFCLGCQEHFQARHLTIDHIIPRAKGGTDHISNLQLLCGSCNTIKGTKTQEELIVALTDKGYIKRKMAA